MSDHEYAGKSILPRLLVSQNPLFHACHMLVITLSVAAGEEMRTRSAEQQCVTAARYDYRRQTFHDPVVGAYERAPALSFVFERDSFVL